MKILNRLFIVFIVGALLPSCNNEWNDHFEPADGSSSGADDDLYSYISADAKYSEFKKLVDEASLSSLFTDKLEKTLFLPNNDIFEYDSGLDSLGKVQLVKNYLVAGAKYSSSLDVPAIKAYNDKLLNLNTVDANTRTINGVVFTYVDKVSNGVIYELQTNYKAVPNLYEYIISLSDEYSKLRDFVLSKEVKEFLIDESKPISVNEVGETVYDSVFTTKNTFITGANDVMNEERKYTLFLPSDEVIDNAITKVAESYLASTGKEMSTVELVKMEQWCITAIFYRNLTEYLDFSGGEHDITLTDELKSLYKIADGLQELDQNYKELSNGRSYDVTNLHIPKFKYLPTVMFQFWGVENVHRAKVNTYFSHGTH